MPLQSLIVHKIEKAANQPPLVTLRPAVIEITERETDFVEDIREAYYRKSNPIYGIFDPNYAVYRFQTLLRRHLNEEIDFYDFTVEAMTILEGLMVPIPQATDDYVLFARLTSQGQEFVLVVILNDQKAYNINDELDVTEILSIAIDKLDVANTINITRWNANEMRYLSFVKGRKNISEYFLNFIGCTTRVDAKQSSESFKRAFTQYLEDQNLETAREERIRNDVYQYCHDQISNGDDISLNATSAIIDPENPTAFAEFAAAEEYGVSASFAGHDTTLKNLRFFTFTGDGLTLRFNRCEWRDQIEFNPDQNTLTIRHVPDRLRERLEETGII